MCSWQTQSYAHASPGANRWPKAQSVALLHAAWAAQAGDASQADSALARAGQASSQGSQAVWPLLMRAQLAASRGAYGEVCMPGTRHRGLADFDMLF